MGLLDDEYRGTWERQPANDPVHPWSGLLSQRPQATPPMPPDGRYPDAFAYPQPLPRIEDERAYHPTLQYRDSVPGMREAETMRRKRLALEDADTFRQPKTAEEIGLPEMTFEEKLQTMTMGEKLQLLLQRLMGR